MNLEEKNSREEMDLTILEAAGKLAQKFIDENKIEKWNGGNPPQYQNDMKPKDWYRRYLRALAYSYAYLNKNAADQPDFVGWKKTHQIKADLPVLDVMNKLYTKSGTQTLETDVKKIVAILGKVLIEDCLKGGGESTTTRSSQSLGKGKGKETEFEDEDEDEELTDMQKKAVLEYINELQKKLYDLKGISEEQRRDIIDLNRSFNSNFGKVSLQLGQKCSGLKDEELMVCGGQIFTPFYDGMIKMNKSSQDQWKNVEALSTTAYDNAESFLGQVQSWSKSR